MFTAEQKVRHTLTGNPMGEPHFQHEGNEVVRWVTGGTLPDIYVTFDRQDNLIEVHCSTCKATLGYIAADFSGDVAQQLGAMRLAKHQHDIETPGRPML